MPDEEHKNAREIVTLRDYLELRITSLEEKIDLILEKSDSALKLQAGEIARRLQDLNHEQARLAMDRERYLPRETYAANREDDIKWRTNVDIALASGVGKSQGIMVAIGLVISMVMAGIALAAVLVK